MAGLLVLGAGYIGAAAAEQALAAGEAVALADDWSTTDRWQVNGLEADGASVHTVDIRNRAAVEELLAAVRPDRVLLLAAQASRPIADREPDRTEEINILGTRRVAEAIGAGRAAAERDLRLLPARLRPRPGAARSGPSIPTARRATSRTCPRSTAS